MNQLPKWLFAAAILGVLVLFFAWTSLQPPTEPIAPTVSYSAFKDLLSQGEVEAVSLEGDEVVATLKRPRAIGNVAEPVNRVTTRAPAFGDPALLPALETAGVELSVGEDQDDGGRNVLYAILPWLLIFGLYWWFWGRMYRNVAGGMGGMGGRGDVGGFLEGTARKEDKSAPRITFDDVAGQDNAKREVAELVDYLRAPEKYTRLGASVPHGVLLMGPPGTGKTLLARALAGEAGVSFFNISASEFIEMFVGVGASRVRRMFDEAKKRAPSIIFIDELDSVGRTRGAGFGGGHDEREQTLNQILAEMDGFGGHEAVIILAATNRPDVLDPALLRPGRFDRHVTLDLPDLQAREAILRVHTRKVPVDPGVDFSVLAAGTPGFSGADLKNLVNEAAMAAARERADVVSAEHFEEMRDKLLMGTARTLAIQPEERHRLAVHESGHTIVAFFLPEADPLHKVTIIPRGRALGATQQLPEEDRHTLPDAYLRDRMAIMMGGRVAERTLLGSISSGADDDIRQATQLARAMVGRWGMSEEIGPVDVRESDEHPFLGREMAMPRHISEATAEAVDKAVRKLLGKAEDRAGEIIEGRRPDIERLIAALEERESLDHDEIDALLSDTAPPSTAAPSARSA